MNIIISTICTAIGAGVLVIGLLTIFAFICVWFYVSISASCRIVKAKRRLRFMQGRFDIDTAYSCALYIQQLDMPESGTMDIHQIVKMLHSLKGQKNKRITQCHETSEKKSEHTLQLTEERS